VSPSASLRRLILIWAGWAVVLLTFQHWAPRRFQLERPDRVLEWTIHETTADSQDDKPYLLDPFLNEHVAWDSEFYLAIAMGGYDDPAVRAVPSTFTWRESRLCTAGLDADCTSLSYAFFPLYPVAIRIVAVPFQFLDLTPIARATLAGTLVSLLGTLGAVLALRAITRTSLGEEGALRAAFYFLVFPSGFFLAQVYSEGFYLGLVFGALACLLARKWALAALLAALAVWTRPGMALLVIPMLWIWFYDRTWTLGWKRALLRGLAALTPALAYGVWSLTSLGRNFFLIERLFFGRRLLAVGSSLAQWRNAFPSLGHAPPATTFYYALEFAAVALAIAACFMLLRQRPELSLFGLAAVAFAFTSGSPQGMTRYVLPAVPMFWVLARWGRNPAFDRTWSLISILLLGVAAILFSFDFWVA
jgi:hypothetical protein